MFFKLRVHKNVKIFGDEGVFNIFKEMQARPARWISSNERVNLKWVKAFLNNEKYLNKFVN